MPRVFSSASEVDTWAAGNGYKLKSHLWIKGDHYLGYRAVPSEDTFEVMINGKPKVLRQMVGLHIEMCKFASGEPIGFVED